MDLVRVIRPVRHFNVCHLLFKEVQAKNVSCALIKIPYDYMGELEEVRAAGAPGPSARRAARARWRSRSAPWDLVAP